MEPHAGGANAGVGRSLQSAKQEMIEILVRGQAKPMPRLPDAGSPATAVIRGAPG